MVDAGNLSAKGGRTTDLGEDLTKSMRGLQAGGGNKTRTFNSQSPTAALKNRLSLHEEIKESADGESFERYATFKTTQLKNFKATDTPKDKMQRLDKVKDDLAKDL